MSIGSQKKTIPGVKKVIGVLSGKGGVGKSFVASNLAIAFGKLQKKIGLLDADIYCSNIFKMLGITAKMKTNEESQVLPVEKWGMKVVSMAGLSGTDDEPAAWRGPIISKITSKLMEESLWGELDALIVDMPTGSGDITLTVLQNFTVDGLIIVTTPQALSTLDARRMAKMASQLKIPVFGIIENLRGDIFGEGGGNILAEKFGLHFLGSIPARKQISALLDQGVPPIFHIEEVDMIFMKIARSLLEHLETDEQS